LQRGEELREGLELGIRQMETARADLKKLLDIVFLETIVDELCHRINDIAGLLDIGLERCCEIYAKGVVDDSMVM
jgi:hypothetical protein